MSQRDLLKIITANPGIRQSELVKYRSGLVKELYYLRYSGHITRELVGRGYKLTATGKPLNEQIIL